MFNIFIQTNFQPYWSSSGLKMMVKPILDLFSLLHANKGAYSLMINLSMRIVKNFPVTCEPFFRTGTDKQ